MIQDFAIIQQKHTLICPGLYRLIFQFLYHTALLLPKWETDETVNFRNLASCSQINLSRFFFIFWHPIFKWDKRNEATGHMKHAAMAVTCTLHWGKLTQLQEDSDNQNEQDIVLLGDSFFGYLQHSVLPMILASLKAS